MTLPTKKERRRRRMKLKKEGSKIMSTATSAPFLYNYGKCFTFAALSVARIINITMRQYIYSV